MRSPLRPTVAGAVSLAAALAACGSSGSDAAKQFAHQGVAKVEAQAFAATKGLRSVHVAGHADSATTKVDLDLSLDDQKNCSGSVSVNGKRLDVLSARGSLYFKASLATWATLTNLDNGRLQKLSGKWVTGLAASEVSDFARICDIANLLSTYPTQAGKDDRIIGTAQAGGKPLVMVKGTFGGAAVPITINVLATEPHYMTRLSTTSTDLSLSAFDQPVQVTAPADSDVVHVSQP